MFFCNKTIVSNFVVFAIFLLSFTSASATSPLYLHSEIASRNSTVTCLLTIFTRDTKAAELKKEQLQAIFNTYCPGQNEGEIGGLLLEPANIIIGFENESKPFSAEFLKDFGRGITGDDIDRLNQPSQILVIGLTADNKHEWVLKATTLLAYAVAQQFKGTIFDVNTLECFSVTTFHELRIKKMLGELTSNVITRVCKPENKIYRLVTRGMKKYGMPDLSLTQIPEERLEIAHLLLMGACNKLLHLQKTGATDTTSVTLTGEDITTIIKPGQTPRNEIRNEAAIQLAFYTDERTSFDDLNRVLSVNPGVGETVSVLLAAERIFKVKRDSFDYLKYEKLKPIADLAKKDLKEAVKRFQQKRSGDEFFFLIIPIMEREKDSLVWVKAATMSNPQEFVGILIPNQMTNTLSAGDSLIFTENTIFDWMLVEKGKIVAGDYLRRSYKELQNNQ